MALLPYKFSSGHQIFLKLSQNVETIVMNINLVLLTPKKLWFTPLGEFYGKMHILDKK